MAGSAQIDRERTEWAEVGDARGGSHPATAGPISEDRIEVDGIGVHVRRSAGAGAPVVFSHGNPTHSGEWVDFLGRIERPAIAFDLPGWGRSDSPSPRDFDGSMRGLARFFGRVLDALEVEEHALVVHDWGALALIDAVRRPHRVECLVVINAVPLLPGYRWHWIARLFWRVPVAGELFNLAANRSGLRQISRQANATPGPMPDEFINMVWEAWPAGPRRPILDLYRSADPAALAAAGHGLDRLDCPALVIWGERDPYLPGRFARAYAARLADAELVLLGDAGHWPWIDRPDLVDRICAFLERAPRA